MDGTGPLHAKWNKAISQRPRTHIFTHMYNLQAESGEMKVAWEYDECGKGSRQSGGLKGG